MQRDSGLLPLLWILLILVVVGYLILDQVYVFTYLVVGIGVLLGAGALFVIGYTAYWLIRNRIRPTVRVQARVVRRRKKDWDVTLVGGAAEAQLGLQGRQHREAWRAYSRKMAGGEVSEVELASGTNYFVTFLADGNEVEFCTPEDDYIRCNEGAQGLLVYRGEEFVHFIPGVPQALSKETPTYLGNT